MEQTLTGDQICALMSEAFGRPIRYEAVPVENWPAYMTEHWGVPAAQAKSSLGTMRAIENGEFDIVSGDYEAITGRKPKSMREFLTRIATSRGTG